MYMTETCWWWLTNSKSCSLSLTVYDWLTFLHMFTVVDGWMKCYMSCVGLQKYIELKDENLDSDTVSNVRFLQNILHTIVHSNIFFHNVLYCQFHCSDVLYFSCHCDHSLFLDLHWCHSTASAAATHHVWLRMLVGGTLHSCRSQ